MSLKLMTWVFHESQAKGIDKLVLLAIADHAYDDGVSAYPGMTLLAKKAGIGKGTVCRAIERLAALGELEVTDRQTSAKVAATVGRGTKLSYRIITAKKVPERNDRKVPERDDTAAEGSAGDGKKVPLTTPPIEEEPSPSLNRKTKPTSPQKGRPSLPPPPEVAWDLARLLAESVEHRFPQFGKPKIGLEWAKDIDLLMRSGPPEFEKGLEERQIRKLIAWLDDAKLPKAVFWGPNIRSANKLRLKAADLVAGWFDDHGMLPNGQPKPNGNGYRNGQPERRSPTIPEADLSQLPPTDPDKLAAWYDRQLEGIPT